MGQFRQMTYTNAGNEIDFMQGLIDMIADVLGVSATDSSGNPTTAAEQFADSTATAQFWFFLGDNFNFRLIRGARNDAATYQYAYAWGDGYANYFSFGVEKLPSVETTRSVFFAYAKTENAGLIWIKSSDTVSMAANGAGAIVVRNGGKTYAAGAGWIQNLLSLPLLGDNKTVYWQSALGYANAAGAIDYIEKSIFTSGGVKLFDCADFKTCSTVAAYQSIATANGRNFYTLATNFMIELDSET